MDMDILARVNSAHEGETDTDDRVSTKLMLNWRNVTSTWDTIQNNAVQYNRAHYNTIQFYCARGESRYTTKQQKRHIDTETLAVSDHRVAPLGTKTRVTCFCGIKCAVSDR